MANPTVSAHVTTYQGYRCDACRIPISIGETVYMPDCTDRWHCGDCAMEIEFTCVPCSRERLKVWLTNNTNEPTAPRGWAVADTAPESSDDYEPSDDMPLYNVQHAADCPIIENPGYGQCACDEIAPTEPTSDARQAHDRALFHRAFSM